MLGWYHDMAKAEKRSFWTCWLGWSLDAMDVQIYSFAMPTLIVLWGMTKGEAGLIGTSALLASAFGGWLAGMLADRIGRVRLLQITIAWFSLFTALSALTNSFGELLVVRMLQGFGFGGEWAAGAVLMGEVVAARHRGKAVGTVQSGWAIGWGAAALLYALLFSLLPEDIAWRAMFAVGLAPALLVLFVRRWVEEPKLFVESRARVRAGEARSNGLAIFAPPLLATTALAAVLVTGAQGGYYALAIWLPTYLKTERGLSVLDTGGYVAVLVIGSWLGFMTSAYLNDLIGRRRNFVLFALGSVAALAIYLFLPISNALMLWLGAPLGFFSLGVFSGMGPLLTELYPTAVRGSGQGFCYNFGRGLGALFPALVGYLSATMPLAQAIGAFAVSAYAVVVVAALALPETRGKELGATG